MELLQIVGFQKSIVLAFGELAEAAGVKLVVRGIVVCVSHNQEGDVLCPRGVLSGGENFQVVGIGVVDSRSPSN